MLEPDYIHISGQLSYVLKHVRKQGFLYGYSTDQILLADSHLTDRYLKEEYFTFVGGASIPLCHRMTIGEMALWIKEKYYPECDLNIVWMKNWRRSSLFSETGLPWVLPSPNMPTLQTAIVYPGTVLIEALNLSEGRGTTIPFELFGAPFIDSEKLKKNLDERNIEGCAFRIHNFIPTFHKFCGELCNGLQIHVTDINIFKTCWNCIGNI